ncbi:calmodulin, flagellar-like [Hydra vulgaris]|uniref:Calmodulin, flagellar-like n=1 Tax=Hydra vulgaris TaxID=6087 RepID=A0ABM4BPW7_HYDVU
MHRKVSITTYFDFNTPVIVLKSLFLKYDSDRNNYLNRDELKTLFIEDLGFSTEQCEVYTFLLDKDGNNKISFDEFVSWLKSGEHFKNISNKSRYQRLKKAVEMFKKFDVDNNQSLDRDEFKRLFISLNGDPPKLDAALAELDRDGNNKISFEEFLRWLNWVPLDHF